MRSAGFLRLSPALVMLAAFAAAAFLFAHSPSVRADCPAPASGVPPCPANAFLSLDVTAGDANTVITVTGGQFLPNEKTDLYWDTPGHVAGSATADGSGSFSNVKVRPHQGDGPGLHKLCASVQPNPCADFTINGPPSPSPSPSPTPSPSPSPSESPSEFASSAPIQNPGGAPPSGFDVITRPPFVFLPIAGALGIALSVGYWLVAMARRPRQRVIPTAAVVHRAMRPDYSAGFGTPPPAPTQPAEPSAWNEPVHQMPPAGPPSPQDPGASSTPPPTAPGPEVPEADWGPPVEWGTGSGDWGFPEPPPVQDDVPEPPPPGD